MNIDCISAVNVHCLCKLGAEPSLESPHEYVVKTRSEHEHKALGAPAVLINALWPSSVDESRHGRDLPAVIRISRGLVDHHALQDSQLARGGEHHSVDELCARVDVLVDVDLVEISSVGGVAVCA